MSAAAAAAPAAAAAAADNKAADAPAAAAPAAAAAAAPATPNLTGTWVLDVAKSDDIEPFLALQASALPTARDLSPSFRASPVCVGRALAGPQNG